MFNEKHNTARIINHSIIEENHKTREVNYRVANAVLKTCKDDNLKDAHLFDDREIKRDCQISREVHMSYRVYKMFTEQLLDDFSFLEGMGGSNTGDVRINSMDDYNKMSPDEQKTVKWYNCNTVAIFVDGQLMLIIDPQGYGYARYVYLPL